ncbi:MAG: PEP-CTERM sorting domain-containing protein [Verrucomicrobiota bacterium]
MQGKEKENKMKKMTMIIGVVALAAFSAQAELIDFESPTYSVGALNGQDGWAHSTGSANVVADSTVVGPTASSVINYGWAASAWLQRDLDVTPAAAMTVEFDVSQWSGTAVHKFYLRDQANRSYAGVYLHATAGVWGYQSGGGLTGNVYSGALGIGATASHVKMDLDFSTSTYDLYIYDNGGALRGSLADISFVGADTTLANMEASGGARLSINNTYASTLLGYDNIEVVPEPATLGLLGLSGAGLLFLRRKLS